MAENKNSKMNPLLIVSITVISILSLVFIIILYDVWKDYDPISPPIDIVTAINLLNR